MEIHGSTCRMSPLSLHLRHLSRYSNASPPSLHLRQRLIERKFEQALEDLGSPSRHHTVLEGFTVDESKEYPVTSVLKDLHTDETYTVESKTMVGVDGGHSFVRKTAGIEFKGDRSANKWIRLDVSCASPYTPYSICAQC